MLLLRPLQHNDEAHAKIIGMVKSLEASNVVASAVHTLAGALLCAAVRGFFASFVDRWHALRTVLLRAPSLLSPSLPIFFLAVCAG